MSSVYVITSDDLDMIEETQHYLEENVALGTKLITILNPTIQSSQLRLACQLGFKDPIVISDHEVLLYTTFSHNFNHTLSAPKDCVERVLRFVSIALDNWKQPGCSMNLVLDQNSMKLLKAYALHYKFHSKNSKVEAEQREISGIFRCEPIVFRDTITTLSVSIDESTVSTGEKEEADYKLANGTFHSHPEEAYQNNNVGCAWPSKDDYRTVLDIFSEGYGLFHIVSTVEGIYLITFKSSVQRKEIKKNMKTYMSQIQKNFKFTYPPYDVPSNQKRSIIDAHLDLINNKIQPSIFQLQFYPWDAIPDSIVIENDKDSETGQCNFMDGQVQFHGIIDELRNDCRKNPGKNKLCTTLFKN